MCHLVLSNATQKVCSRHSKYHCHGSYAPPDNKDMHQAQKQLGHTAITGTTPRRSREANKIVELRTETKSAG